MSAYGTDSYTAATGFPLTLADAKSFALFIANRATAAGLGVGLLATNALLSDPAVVAAFDFAVSGCLVDILWSLQQLRKHTLADCSPLQGT
jgi:hypothetical protein